MTHSNQNEPQRASGTVRRFVRHPNAPVVGCWFRHGRRWWNPIHKVVRIENRRVFSEGDWGNTGTCYPLWLWRRKYYLLSNPQISRDGGKEVT